MICLHTPTAFR